MGYRRYQRALRNAGAVDFDDLLLCTEELFAKHVEARREEAARFDHLLIVQMSIALSQLEVIVNY